MSAAILKFAHLCRGSVQNFPNLSTIRILNAISYLKSFSRILKFHVQVHETIKHIFYNICQVTLFSKAIEPRNLAVSPKKQLGCLIK